MFRFTVNYLGLNKIIVCLELPPASFKYPLRIKFNKQKNKEPFLYGDYNFYQFLIS